MSENNKKIYTCPMHPEVEQEQPGMCPECGMNLVFQKPSKKRDKHKEDSGDNKKIYTCPMHPEVEQEQPGMCPECGMNLVFQKPSKKHGEPKEDSGEAQEKHAGHSTKMFLRKFWLSLVLTIPLLAYSELTELFLGISVPGFAGQEYVMLVLGSVIYFYAGWQFLSGAAMEIKARLPGMMTLIGVAVTAAYLWSIYAVFTGSEPLFWELATLVTIMLLGHWIEMKAVQGARGALRELSKLLPNEAELVVSESGETETVLISELKLGDTILVKPGARVPADGKITEGRSELDESIVTGESKPVVKEQDDEVIAGTINGDGSLKVEITKIGDDTFLAGVMRLVAEAQASKSRMQLLSDKAALVLTAVAIGTGILTLIAWLIADVEISFAVARLVAVLVIACPHALGLAIPLVASISTNMAAENGFIVKQRQALEAARNIDAVLFDKTGTLTKGEFTVAEISATESSKDEALQLAASLEAFSEHPIAKAIVQKAKEQDLEMLDVGDFQRVPGKGISGSVAGEEIKVLQAEEEQGVRTIVDVIKNNEKIGEIALEDAIREESRKAVKTLHDQGIRVAMVTGDAENVAEWVAKELGIDEYFARVLPEQKSEKVKELQARGLKVAMIGDGVNDAPALTLADLGVAIGAGTNVAIESAGIILAKNDPRDIPKIISLSRLTYRKMIQNLFWATGYNVVALPLAAGVLFAQGIVIEPAVGAIFMSISTVVVAVNAVFLRRQKL